MQAGRAERDVEAEVARAALRERLFGMPDHDVRFGRYVPRGTIGRGGMGVVYRAHDEQLGRDVAIKVVRSDARDLNAARRLRQEARALARLSHPNIVEVFEVGALGDGRLFIAMELVEGLSLRQWHATRPRLAQIVAMYISVAQGLAAAHAADVVHRDFKPDNVIVGADGRPRIVDFGLAWAVHGTPTSVPEDAVETSPRITGHGSRLGTPAYMSPEQFMADPTTAATDQFSFCVSLYEAAYGVRPFRGSSLSASARGGTTGRLEISAPSSRVPARLRRILLRGLAVDPKDRFPSMADVVLALQDFERSRRRRAVRWRLAATGVVLASAAAALAFGGGPSTGPCDGKVDALAGAWDPTVAARVHDAFAATPVAFRLDAAARVEAVLDAYAEDWRRVRAEVCGTGDNREARLLCLDARRHALASLTEAMTRANPTTVETAVAAAVDLPPSRTCVDTESQSLPVPFDAATAAEVAGLRLELDRVRALGRTGQMAARLSAAQRATAGADELGWAPVRAEAWYELGTAHGATGDYVAAEDALVRAFELAVATGYDRVAAGAATDLTFIVGVRLERLEDGQQWARHAEALHPERSLRLDGSRGHMLMLAGRLDEAEGVLADVVAEGRRTWGDGDLRLADPLSMLANVAYQRGRPEEGLALMQEALANKEAALGPTHPAMARALSNVGAMAAASGDLELAQASLERARALLAESRPEDDPLLVDTLLNLGTVAAKRGDYERARQLHTRVLAARRRIYGEGSVQEARARGNLAQALIRVGDLDGARVHLEAAIAIYESERAGGTPDLAQAYSILGEVMTETGEFDRSIAYHERALALLQEIGGAATLDLADTQAAIAMALAASGRKPEAIERTRDALASVGQLDGPVSVEMIPAASNLGQWLVDVGRLDEGVVQLERALAAIEEGFGADSTNAAYALLPLAEVHHRRGELDRARTLAERALQLRRDGGLGPSFIATAQATLAPILWDAGQRDHALETAAEAEAALEAAGPGEAQALQELRAWMDGHGRARR